jgi:hypothetical protein
MAPTSDYKKAYDAARKELSDLLSQQMNIEKRAIVVRQSIQTLAALCESEGIAVEPSLEAAYLLDNSTLADEIRAIMRAHAFDATFRPSEIKSEMERLGRDLSQYQNPQSTIHMVLKRMAESGEIEERKDLEGKLTYRMPHPLTGLRKPHPVDHISNRGLKAPVPPASMRKRLGLDKK